MKRNKTRVLILDDEEKLLRNLSAFLDDDGFAVFSAREAEAGLRLLGERDLDAAIVDMRLPGMNGNEFIEKAHAIKPEMRFLIHTGSISYRLPRNLLEIGVRKEHVFFKPIKDMKIFSMALDNLMNEQEHETE